MQKSDDMNDTLKDIIRINGTLHQFLKENMQFGIFNMEDIHKMMLCFGTCVFHVPMTTVLIQKTSFFKSGKKVKLDMY